MTTINPLGGPFPVGPATEAPAGQPATPADGRETTRDRPNDWFAMDGWDGATASIGAATGDGRPAGADIAALSKHVLSFVVAD